MEWYAEIAVRFARPMPVQTEGYTERVERFYDALSEYLGGLEYEPSMLCRERGIETYVYVKAPSPQVAARLAIRPFPEAAEAVWGPGGTAAEVLRVVSSEERDRELEREGGPFGGDDEDSILSLADDPVDDVRLPADASENLDRYLYGHGDPIGEEGRG